jgi:phage virion morphogenesis protein
MAGARIESRWDSANLAKLNKVFAELQTQTEDFTPLMQDINEYLLPAHQDRIAQGITPDGLPFEPLSEDYKKSIRKRESRGADKILILDDFLHGDLAYQIDSDGRGSQLGTNTIYGATHQFGRGGIVPRPYLGLATADLVEIEAIARDYLAEIIGS